MLTFQFVHPVENDCPHKGPRIGTARSNARRDELFGKAVLCQVCPKSFKIALRRRFWLLRIGHRSREQARASGLYVCFGDIISPSAAAIRNLWPEIDHLSLFWPVAVVAATRTTS